MTPAPDQTGHSPDRRKLIAVLHMDMVGYSRLIGLDDVGTLARLRHLRSNVIDPAIETEPYEALLREEDRPGRD